MYIKLSTLVSTMLLSFIFSQDPCTCENDFTPVCGLDGFTYPNECIAICFGTQVDYDGECGSQINCGPGEYTDADGNCGLCEPGTFSIDGISCDACQPGTSSNGQMFCDMPGYEGMSDCGATGCNECDAGTYAMGNGNSYCDYCQSGSYASSSGASECDACPNNLYSNGQMDCWEGIPECGATECVDCNGQSWGDAIIDENGDCSDSQSGCTYIEAYNFNPEAYMDDGSCIFPCQGDFNGDNNKDILDLLILVNEILDDIYCQ